MKYYITFSKIDYPIHIVFIFNVEKKMFQEIEYTESKTDYYEVITMIFHKLRIYF